MKGPKLFLVINAAVLGVLFVGVAGSFVLRAKKINNYERVSLSLIKENKNLKRKIEELEFQVSRIKNENSVLSLKLEDKILRQPASYEPVDPSNDLVELKTYRWDFSQLLSSANEYFQKQDYARSAQYFQTILKAFPQHEQLTDDVIYNAAIASFESKVYRDWAKINFEKIIREYPTSTHFRGSKLWLGLISLEEGKKKKFFNVVEEFRKKYRNTKEWELISGHYYEIYKNFKF